MLRQFGCGVDALDEAVAPVFRVHDYLRQLHYLVQRAPAYQHGIAAVHDDHPRVFVVADYCAALASAEVAVDADVGVSERGRQLVVSRPNSASL